MLSNKFSQPIGQYISHSYRKQNYCLKPYILRPNQHLLVQIQQQHTVQNMFKVNNRSNTRCSGVFTVNYEYIWHVSNVFLFVCFCFAEVDHVIARWNIYFFNLNYSMCFKIRSRNPVTFKTQLSVTTVNSCFQLFSFFLSQRAPSEMWHMIWTEYCNMIHGKIWKPHSPRYPKNLFPEVFC